MQNLIHEIPIVEGDGNKFIYILKGQNAKCYTLIKPVHEEVADSDLENYYGTVRYYEIATQIRRRLTMKTKLNQPRISSYKLCFKIEPEQNFFIVFGNMTIKNETVENVKYINILLYYDLKVKSIKDNNNFNLHFTQEKVSLKDEEKYYVNNTRITLDNVIKPDEQVKLYIEYDGSINGYPNIMAYVKDTINKEFSIIRPDSHAYPIIAQPSYENILKSYNNTFTYNLIIDVPNEYTAACGGILKEFEQKENRNVFQYMSELPTWRFDIGIARYSIVEDRDINLKIFAFPEHKDNAENIVRKEIRRAFNLFTSLFGSYRKDNHFTVIEVKESYGSQAGDNYITMEEHGFGSDITKLTHLYHEIGHTWNVKTKYEVQRTRFFDEAFASYFEALAIKKFYGINAFKEKMEFYRQCFIKSVNEDKINYDTPIIDYGKYEIGCSSYTKGAWALYVLNEIVGDVVFNRIIRTFLNRFKDVEADFNDFEKVVDKISNDNLNKFFSQWIYGIESSEELYLGKDISEMINSTNTQNIVLHSNK